MHPVESKPRARVMVLGAGGMLGHMVTTFLEDSGHDVISVTRNGHFGQKPVAVDLEDWRSLRSELELYRPDWVINAAGLLNEEVDQMKVSAILINSSLPQHLSAIGPEIGFRTITVGSDCVFEGDRGRYSVDDPPDALSSYGRTKQLGELQNSKDLTIRTSIIGPEIDPDGRGLFLWVMSQKSEVEGWTAAIWTGVTTLELAKVIEAVVSSELQETGLWQLVPGTAISKFDLLHLINSTFLESQLTINAVPGLGHDRSLINDRVSKWMVPSYLEMLSELKEWMHSHASLYNATVFAMPEEYRAGPEMTTLTDKQTNGNGKP